MGYEPLPVSETTAETAFVISLLELLSGVMVNI